MAYLNFTRLSIRNSVIKNQYNIINQKTKNLAATAVSAVGWNLSGGIARAGAGFAINIVLARLLGPEPYGLLAIALLVVSLGNLVVESGLSIGLVQKKEITAEDVSFVFTLQMAAGVGLTLLVILSAPLLSLFFTNPHITPILRAMSLMLVFQAFAQVPMALLKRELAFKKIQQAQISSYLLAYLGLGLPLAYFGYGAWSLVIAQLMQSLFNAMQVFIYARHSLRMRLSGSGALARFGMRVLGAYIANWILANIDSLLIGRFFGITALGLYNRSYFLVSTPVGIVVTSVQGVLFSTTSRIQDEPELSRRSFLGVFSLLAVLFIPMCAAVAIVAPTLIKVVYGLRWIKAVPLVVPLALSMPLFALMAIEGPVLTGLGRPEKEMRAQWYTVLWGVILLGTASQVSLQATAWAVFVLYLVRLILMTRSILDVLDISKWVVLRPVCVSAFLTLLVIGVVWEAGMLLPAQWTLLSILLIQAFIGLGVWGGVLVVGRRWFLGEEAFWIVRNLILTSRIPIVKKIILALC